MNLPLTRGELEGVSDRPETSPHPSFVRRGIYSLQNDKILRKMTSHMDTLISKFHPHVGEVVTIKGWAYNVRSSGSIAFLQIRDGSGFTQAVIVKNGIDEASWNAAVEATIESSVIVTGNVSKHPKQEGVYELQATKVELIQKAEE